MADKKTGIYFIDPQNNEGNAIDNSAIIEYVNKIPLVKEVWRSQEVALVKPEVVAAKIKKADIERLVIAGSTPGMTKGFFARAMTLAGKKAEDIVLAGYREYNAVSNDDIDLAKAVVSCAVNNVPFESAVKPEQVNVNPETLVIGGGIAGVQASIEIADAGQKVHLVEKSATIGGVMATFDKTFPTLDCAACILTPKMGEVGQHENINMMTYSEVQSITGTPGNYTVKILKKARFVNIKTCIGCGTCAEKCPAKVPSEFDSGTTMRKAVYIPFPQAVPNKYVIDAEHCTKLLKDKCGVCQKVCPVPDCIDYTEKDEIVEITVGNIIVATGYQPFDAKTDDRYGYGKFPNVVTSLEFERLVNASGPTGGNIYLRQKDKKGNPIFTQNEGVNPKSIAIIHCVGSRDKNFNKYCSKVCCMYSLKLAHLVVEKLPDAKVSEYYIDIRSFGKGYEEFYKRIESEGVNIIRGRTAKIDEGKDGKLLLRSEDITGLKLLEEEYDMVVLAIGLEPCSDSKKIADMVGITQSEDGWFMESNYVSDPTSTFTGGISIAGVCQGPKDIPDTVAQASATASRVLQSIMNGKMDGNVKDVPLADIEKNIINLS